MSKDNKYVHLVEDSPVQRRLCQKVLMDLGLKVKAYATAEGLLSYIENHRESFLVDTAAVITDFNLGSGLNGGDLTEQLRKMSDTLIIIGISGASKEEEVSGAGALEVFIRKGANRAVDKQHLTQDPPGRWKAILEEMRVLQQDWVITEVEEKLDNVQHVLRIPNMPEPFNPQDWSEGRNRTDTMCSDTVRTFGSFDYDTSKRVVLQDGEVIIASGRRSQYPLENPETILGMFPAEEVNESSSSNKSVVNTISGKKSKVLEDEGSAKSSASEASSQPVRKCCSVTPCSSLVTVIAYVGRGLVSCFGYRLGSASVGCTRE